MLATSDRTAAIALSLDGHVADAAVNPLPLVAGAAAAKAAGDQRSSARLRTQAATLAERREEALLYRRLATLVETAPVSESLEELRFRGVLDTGTNDPLFS